MVKRVVIVEDNPADAKILRMALKDADAKLEMLVFEDGVLAIEYFSPFIGKDSRPPCDLILLDLNLPKISGFEVLEFLKANSELKPIPVVVLSGSSSQTDVAKANAAGADDYMCKPMDLDDVFAMAALLVNRWLWPADTLHITA